MFQKVVLLSGDLHQLGATAYGKLDDCRLPSERDRKAVKGKQRKKTCHCETNYYFPPLIFRTEYRVWQESGAPAVCRPEIQTLRIPGSPRVQRVGRLLVCRVEVVSCNKASSVCMHVALTLSVVFCPFCNLEPCSRFQFGCNAEVQLSS